MRPPLQCLVTLVSPAGPAHPQGTDKTMVDLIKRKMKESAKIVEVKTSTTSFIPTSFLIDKHAVKENEKKEEGKEDGDETTMKNKNN